MLRINIARMSQTTSILCRVARVSSEISAENLLNLRVEVKLAGVVMYQVTASQTEQNVKLVSDGNLVEIRWKSDFFLVCLK